MIVCLGKLAEQAVKETRKIYFPDVKDWDHYFLPHPSGLNRALNDPKTHADAVLQLEAAYKRLLTLKTYEGRMSG